MKLTFVSNYLNHHQIPVSEVLYRKLGADYHFIQTEPMEEERVQMGWTCDVEKVPYLLEYYKQEDACRDLIENSDVVIFGGVEDERYIKSRLNSGKLIIRYSERIYKEGQWKAVSPRGLIKKYQDHTRYRKKQIYLLCSGAYVASDFHIIHAYPNKMFKWGYFPEFIPYPKSLETAIKEKSEVPEILWAGRMISLKHPQKAIETADYLVKRGYQFKMTIIGDGVLREALEQLAIEKNLQKHIDFIGFLSQKEVREYMERADIFLFTSDFNEGWGAVANEAMNSGCALVADVAIGAVPYLIEDGVNGLIYKSGKKDELFRCTEYLLTHKEEREKMGRAAYETIREKWNPQNSAEKLLDLCYNLLKGQIVFQSDGPCSRADIVSPRKMYRYLKKRTKK